MTLFPLLYFFPVTRGELILSPDDGVIFNIPMRLLVANMIHAGYLPLWNPYMFGGMPLFGAAQAGVLFPLNWFYLIFSAPVATNLMMLSTYMLAALGAYLFARRNDASVAGAALTSIVWQTSAFMVAKVGQTNVIQTAALLPWIFWAIERYAATGKRTHGFLLAVLVAAQLFAGHQQTFAYASLLATAYALTMARVSNASRRNRYLSTIGLMVTGLALAAVQVLPTVELLRRSLRATASYDFFSSFSLPPRFLLTLFAPYLMGGGDGQLFRAPYIGPAFAGEYIAYVGALTMILGLIALFLKRDARTNFFAVAVVVCFALAIGRFLPFNAYKIVYYVPVLNLFRVPARHLMEVEFALAVLAGRGLTALGEVRNFSEKLRASLIAAGVVLFLVTLTVTWWRPADFKLGREAAAVTVLRAPELFLPILIAVLSGAALLFFVYHRSRSPWQTHLLLFAVFLFDVCVWGQASGWRFSPTGSHPLWTEPEVVGVVRNLNAKDGNEPYRILTDVQPFFINTGSDELEKYKLGEFMLSLQPDTYSMYGIENAAGYDGFGLSRYSRLAGDMKLWGEVAQPEQSIRGAEREFDLLNVRYFVSQSKFGLTQRRAAEQPASSSGSMANAELVKLGGVDFAKTPLSSLALAHRDRLVFTTPPTEANGIALVTSLAWSIDVKDGETVGVLNLESEDGEKFQFDLKAGEHTAEWSHDRPDFQGKIRHSRAPVATSYTVSDPAGDYQGYSYIARFKLPRTVKVVRGELQLAALPEAPNLTLDLTRASLLKDESSEPLRAERFRKLTAGDNNEQEATDEADFSNDRWRRVSETEYLDVYENNHALPRAWLAGGEVVASDEEQLRIIRSGAIGDKPWDPKQTVLLENASGVNFSPESTAGTATVTRNEPNRIDVTTQSAAPSILVLSENHYPGWRATIDGQKVDTMRVDYNLRGVALPAGNHVVSFAYRPKSVLLGLIISMLSLIGLIAWTANVFDKRKARTSPSSLP